VLANDPSFTAWGWAVLDKDSRVLDAGCIKTKPRAKKLRIREGDDTVRRANEVVDTLLSIIKTYRVSYIVSELPHGSQNASSAKMIGIVIGIIKSMSLVLRIPVEWYSEEDAKKCVLNKSSATKQEMYLAMRSQYKAPWTEFKYKNEAIADALSIHYTASKQSSVLQIFKTQQP